MHFLSLRADHHSQFEIRAYADVLIKILKKWVPITYKAFCSYMLNSAELSQEALQVIKELIKGKKINKDSTGLTNRDWEELQQLLK